MTVLGRIPENRNTWEVVGKFQFGSPRSGHKRKEAAQHSWHHGTKQLQLCMHHSGKQRHPSGLHLFPVCLHSVLLMGVWLWRFLGVRGYNGEGR